MVAKSKRTAIDKYDAKTYRRVTFKLRKDDDAEVIADMDEAFERGESRRTWLNKVFNGYKENKE